MEQGVIVRNEELALILPAGVYLKASSRYKAR